MNGPTKVSKCAYCELKAAEKMDKDIYYCHCCCKTYTTKPDGPMRLEETLVLLQSAREEIDYLKLIISKMKWDLTERGK